MKGVTEGRIVHYVLPNAQHCAAMIVRNWGDDNGSCNLELHPDSDAAGSLNHAISLDDRWRPSVVFDEGGKPGTWHWPENV